MNTSVEVDKGAEFSTCGKYRYVLWRVWDDSLPYAMCIGLNPSTANSEDDDPTISNLTRILRNNGFGGLYMTNLFAMISANPEDLRQCPDPLKDNDVWLDKVQRLCHGIIFCWGNFKQAEYRAKKIMNDHRYRNALCFGKNKNGSPKHPLYLKNNVKLQLFQHKKLPPDPQEGWVPTYNNPDNH